MSQAVIVHLLAPLHVLGVVALMLAAAIAARPYPRMAE